MCPTRQVLRSSRSDRCSTSPAGPPAPLALTRAALVRAPHGSHGILSTVNTISSIDTSSECASAGPSLREQEAQGKSVSGPLLEQMSTVYAAVRTVRWCSMFPRFDPTEPHVEPHGHRRTEQMPSSGPALCPVVDNKLKQMFGITSEVEIRLSRVDRLNPRRSCTSQVQPLDYTQPIEEDFLCDSGPPHSQDCAGVVCTGTTRHAPNPNTEGLRLSIGTAPIQVQAVPDPVTLPLTLHTNKPDVDCEELQIHKDIQLLREALRLREAALEDMDLLVGVEIYIPKHAEVKSVPLQSLSSSVRRRMGLSAGLETLPDSHLCIWICPALFKRSGQKGEELQSTGEARQEVLSKLGNSRAACPSLNKGYGQCRMTFVCSASSVPEGALSDTQRDAVIIHQGRVYLSVKKSKVSSAIDQGAQNTQSAHKRKQDSLSEAPEEFQPKPSSSAEPGASQRVTNSRRTSVGSVQRHIANQNHTSSQRTFAVPSSSMEPSHNQRTNEETIQSQVSAKRSPRSQAAVVGPVISRGPLSLTAKGPVWEPIRIRDPAKEPLRSRAVAVWGPVTSRAPNPTSGAQSQPKDQCGDHSEPGSTTDLDQDPPEFHSDHSSPTLTPPTEILGPSEPDLLSRHSLGPSEPEIDFQELKSKERLAVIKAKLQQRFSM
ncbi:hypothetical protein WMY93_027066 [Mugilogobius chulae]|uniref:Uncharacterized protein n=1 Tax=Mugilogobius chulae TaxID=88201 RepID=A0AAW0MRX0_9GOBI